MRFRDRLAQPAAPVFRAAGHSISSLWTITAPSLRQGKMPRMDGRPQGSVSRIG
jgi:hypothetical protein